MICREGIVMNHGTDYLNRLDAWLERAEGGSIPVDVLRDRGFEIVEPSQLDEANLKAKLWDLIEALASIGLYLWGTDHLSDRELYDRIISEILPKETLLIPEDPYMAETSDMVGNGTDQSARIFLTYYADEEERREWLARFGDPLPPRRPKRIDRDRFLPSVGRKAGLVEDA
jgi:hypothetical protein